MFHTRLEVLENLVRHDRYGWCIALYFVNNEADQLHKKYRVLLEMIRDSRDMQELHREGRQQQTAYWIRQALRLLSESRRYASPNKRWTDAAVDLLVSRAKEVGEQARNQKVGSVADYVDEHLGMISMNFGEIPPKALFIAHFEAYIDPNKKYSITHGSSRELESHPFCKGGNFDANELYEGVCKAVEMFNEGKSDMDDDMSAINIASSVMGTLRFEWI